MTLIVILNALFGISMPISKVLLNNASPLFLTGVRMGIAGIVLLLYEKFYQKESFVFPSGHKRIYFQIIVLGIFASYVLRFYALQYMPSGKASFLLNFSPLLSSVYAYLVFNEKMTRKQWAGLALGFIGMIPMLLMASSQEVYFSEFLFISIPECILLVSAALHTYSFILIQQLVRDKSCSPSFVNGFTMGLGGLLSLVVSLCFEDLSKQIIDVKFCGMLSFLIITSNIICHNIYAYLLRSYSATFLAFSGFLSPIFSTLYGWSFLYEEVTWHFYVSTTIVLCGLYLFHKDEKAVGKKITTPERNLTFRDRL